MKFFITCIFLSFFSILSAQQVFPTQEQNPIWNMYYSTIWPEEPNYKYSLKTTVEIDFCGEIWTPVHRYDSLGNDEGIAIYYRQEGQQVYYRTTTDCEESDYLMYDFSLEEGDTLTIRLDYGIIGFPVDAFFTVALSEEIEVNGVLRKQLWMYYAFGTFLGPHSGFVNWIEGIGDTFYNPFYPVTCFTDYCEVRNSLKCLTTNEDVLYSTGSSFCSDVNNLQRWYVDQNTPSGPGNGSDWDNAFATLQLALDFAEAGDTIWVADGIYYPERKIPGVIFGGSQLKTFTLNPGIVVLGGFEGNETFSEERDWEANPTILSGNLNEESDSTDNAYHVLYTIGTDSTTVLDGFIIQDGHAVSEEWGNDQFGGGILIDTDENNPITSPSIRNCRFIHNTAVLGGAVYCKGQDSYISNPQIKNCFFKNNRSTLFGGAIYTDGGTDELNPRQLTGCTFESNSAFSRGGAIFFYNMTHELILKNCDFIDNYSTGEGAGICMENLVGENLVLIENCLFSGNDANSGGGFFFYYSGYNPEYDNEFSFVFSNSVFEHNIGRADTGGGIVISALGNIANVDVLDCTFDSNFSAFHGAGLYVYTEIGSQTILNVNRTKFINNQNLIKTGGAIACYGLGGDNAPSYSNKMLLSNSFFVDNAGALSYISGFSGGYDGVIKNCTFHNNGSYVISKNWGSDFDYIETYNFLEVSNCILWEPEQPLKRIFYNGAPTNINLYDYTIRNNLISAAACDIAGGWEACGLSNIFNTDPKFLDMEGGDLRLSACSPGINAGDIAGLDTLGLTTDLAGNERILEDMVDIGAYERLSYAVQVEDVNNVSCNGLSDAAVIFSGTGDEPYTFQWENEDTVGETADELDPGHYIFTVTDVNNCEDIVEFDITEPEPLAAFFSATPASGESNADGSLLSDSIAGGTLPYSYYWSTGDTTENINNLLPDLYFLTVTDANGCLFTDSYLVDFVDAIDDLGGERNNFFNLYPNPVQTNISIQLEYQVAVKGNWRVDLLHSSGVLVGQYHFEITQKKGRKTMNLETALPSGVYSAVFNSPLGNKSIYKLVVL